MDEYKVRIRGVEIVVPTIEALDQLIERYGTGASEPTAIFEGKIDKANVPEMVKSGIDKALLRRFIEAGRTGIASKQLALTLGANRKSVQIALGKWAERVGLGGSLKAVFEKNIRDGARGYRLTQEAMTAGKDMLGSS